MRVVSERAGLRSRFQVLHDEAAHAFGKTRSWQLEELTTVILIVRLSGFESSSKVRRRIVFVARFTILTDVRVRRTPSNKTFTRARMFLKIVSTDSIEFPSRKAPPKRKNRNEMSSLPF